MEMDEIGEKKNSRKSQMSVDVNIDLSSICEYAQYDPKIKLCQCVQNVQNVQKKTADDCPHKVRSPSYEWKYFCTNLEINRRICDYSN